MPTVGSQLKAARLARHETLEDISKAIRVRVAYLEALEADDFSRLPSPVHARGFLRLYADYLGLDQNELLQNASTEELPTLEGPLPVVPPLPAPSPVKPSKIWEKGNEALRRAWDRLRSWPGFRARRSPVRLPSPPEPSPPSPDLAAPPALLAASSSTGSPAASTSSPDAGDTLSPDAAASPAPSPLPFSAESPAEGASSAPVAAAKTLPPASPPVSSAELFRQLGNELRAQRQQLGLRLESVAAEIKIPTHVLRALEAGDLESLPAPIITRNHLARYAEFLALDVEETLLRFADVLQARLRERGIAAGGEERRPILPRTLSLGLLLSGDLLFGILLLIALATFALWSINLITAARSRPVLRTTPIPDVLAQNPVMATFTPTVIEILPSPSPTLALTPFVLPTPKGNVQLVIIALERVFLRVSVDGKLSLEERVQPGSTFTFDASNRVELLAANAGVVRVYYNGNDLGLLGNFGETVVRVFTREGLATPTPTLSPTPTITPTLTLTPTATPSLPATGAPPATPATPSR
jgi:cytoskeletal protein RodZ